MPLVGLWLLQHATMLLLSVFCMSESDHFLAFCFVFFFCFFDFFDGFFCSVVSPWPGLVLFRSTKKKSFLINRHTLGFVLFFVIATHTHTHAPHTLVTFDSPQYEIYTSE